MKRHLALIALLVLSVALATPVSAATHIGLQRHIGLSTRVGLELKDAFTLLIFVLAAAQVWLFAPVLSGFATKPPEQAAKCGWCRFR